MFQSFADRTSPAQAREHLPLLRAELERRGLDGFLIPRADEHQGEYVPPHAERLAWLTGFTGSAGAAAVMQDKAAIFVDGRYTLQVQTQTDTDLFVPQDFPEVTIASWLRKNAGEGQKIAYDPWLHTVGEARRLEAACRAAGAELVAVSDNPLDAVWADQPPLPDAPASIQPEARTGRRSADKREEIAGQLKDEKTAAAVLSLPDSIGWLLNIRGRDVPHTPFLLAFAILYEDGHADLFTDPAKIPDDVRNHLGNDVAIQPRSALGEALGKLAGKQVQIDPAWTPAWVGQALTAAGARLKEAADPCLLPKATKTEAELNGARTAHERDGAALTRFLHWLDTTTSQREVTEIEAAKTLEAFRAETGALKDLSFDTISGAGPHGAIVHYRVTESSARTLDQGSLFLVDSGGQYEDGTTDVTRTVPIGTPTDEMRDRFTRVLKGHISLATARFPKGTTGGHLDALARRPLWDAGLDYDHGTGHGVGSYLSVHEGPQNISKSARAFATPLAPGMICSNEPGYYKTGAFGIRIENLVIVTEAAPIAGGERPMMGFETITLAPIDRRLIGASLLTAEEIAWVDAYHARVNEIIRPQLEGGAKAWLDDMTAPLGA